MPEGLKNVLSISSYKWFSAMFSGAGPERNWNNTREIFEKDGIGKVIYFLNVV